MIIEDSRITQVKNTLKEAYITERKQNLSLSGGQTSYTHEIKQLIVLGVITYYDLIAWDKEVTDYKRALSKYTTASSNYSQQEFILPLKPLWSNKTMCSASSQPAPFKIDRLVITSRVCNCIGLTEKARLCAQFAREHDIVGVVDIR